jgi:hypothetical protein
LERWKKKEKEVIEKLGLLGLLNLISSLVTDAENSS